MAEVAVAVLASAGGGALAGGLGLVAVTLSYSFVSAIGAAAISAVA